MTGRRVLLLSLAVLVTAAGCGRSPMSRFYVLSSIATADGSPVARYAVAVGPVSVPGAVDRPQLVVQTSPNNVALDEFNRWASPLADEIARTVAGNLTTLLGTPRVASGALPNLDASYRVAIDVQRFESAPGTAATLDAVWTVRPALGSPSRSGRTVAVEPVDDPGMDALVAAHDRALARLSGDIASAIRAAALEAPRGKSR
jgi:uncharacterized lipoprotein YmbA